MLQLLVRQTPGGAKIDRLIQDQMELGLCVLVHAHCHGLWQLGAKFLCNRALWVAHELGSERGIRRCFSGDITCDRHVELLFECLLYTSILTVSIGYFPMSAQK